MTMQVTTGQQKARIVQRLDLEAVSAESLGDDRLAAAPAPLPAPVLREQSA